MIILTEHAIKRIVKRLLKRKSYSLIEVYRAALEFCSKSKKLEFKIGKEKRVIYVYEGYVLVGKVLEGTIMKKHEIINILNEIKQRCKDKGIFVFEDRVFNLSDVCISEILQREDYLVYYNIDKCILYVGNQNPVLIFTYRPAKRKERGEPYFWIININEKFIKRIRKGVKTIEIRKIVPKELREGDIVFVYSTKQHKIVGYFIVKKIKKIKVEKVLEYLDELGISKSDLFNYLSSSKKKQVYLIFFDKFYEIDPPLEAKLNFTNICRVPKNLLDELRSKVKWNNAHSV